MLLLDSVRDPEVPVTILNNMGRCGSTMACKALSQITDLRVMSEPWALLDLQYHFQKGRFGVDTYSKLITALLRIQVNHNQTKGLKNKFSFSAKSPAPVLLPKL